MSAIPRDVRENFGVIVEGLVEVTHTEEEQRAGMLRAKLQVLIAGRSGQGSVHPGETTPMVRRSVAHRPAADRVLHGRAPCGPLSPLSRLRRRSALITSGDLADFAVYRSVSEGHLVCKAEVATSQRGTTVVGEMGTGKTFIAASAAHMAGFERVLVLCPPHLTRKWKREVEETVPGARAVIVASITDLERLRATTGTGPLFAIMSRERAKLSYRWQPAVVQRWATTARGLVRHEETGEPFRVPCCPDCHEQIVDKDGVPLLGRDLARRKRWCPECGSALWQADRSGPKRYPLADYVKHRLKGFFDLLVGDEVHEYKGRGSAQGIAAGVLADACGKSLSLSGTLMGGYSSTLFHLLYRFSPEIRTEFRRSEEGRWIERYGFVEHTVGRDDGDSLEDGRTSRRRKYRKVIRERPGLAPAALFHLIGNSVFLRLSDVAAGLPPYEERVLLSSMDTEADAAGLSQRSGYEKLFGTLRAALAEALSQGSRRLLATYLQTLLAYPDGCTRGEAVFDPESEELLVQVPPLPAEKLYPKEQALVDLVAAERLAGRRVLVYVTHTGTRDITGRMEEFLGRHGFRVAVMKADAVPPERREAWVAKRVEEGVDVLVCHPRLVQTGLDLVDFPTIVWLETDYSVYTMRQASRRSWRIGQTQPVQVVFMAYRNTLQADTEPTRPAFHARSGYDSLPLRDAAGQRPSRGHGGSCTPRTCPQVLLDNVAVERLHGQRVLVYATHIGTRDITGRMEALLRPPRVQGGGTCRPTPSRRSAARRGGRSGPRRAPTCSSATCGWSTRASTASTSRRLSGLKRTTLSSLAVEGELPEDSLADFEDDRDDLMLALVRKIVARRTPTSVALVFAQAQQVAADPECRWSMPEL